MRLRPAPVHAAIDLLGELADLDLLVFRSAEVRLAEKHAGEQDRRIDCGELAVLEPLPGLHIDEMVEEPLVAGNPMGRRTLRRIVEESQRGQHPLARGLAGDIAAFDADRIRGEPEAYRCDARKRGCRIAVRDQAVLRIRGIPEEAEGALLELDQERIEHGTGVAEDRVDKRAPRAVAVAYHQSAHHDRDQRRNQHTNIPTLQLHRYSPTRIASRAHLHGGAEPNRDRRNPPVRSRRTYRSDLRSTPADGLASEKNAHVRSRAASGAARLLHTREPDGSGKSRGTCRPRIPDPGLVRAQS